MIDLQREPRFQSDFYRDSFHRLLRGLMINIVIIILLIAAIIYVIFFHAEPAYYATTNSGLILPLQGVS